MFRREEKSEGSRGVDSGAPDPLVALAMIRLVYKWTTVMKHATI